MSFFEAFDPSFKTYVLGNAPVKRIASGFDWTEGPVWFGDAGALLSPTSPMTDHAMGAGRGRQHLPATVKLRERPHAGPAGPSYKL